MRDLLTTGLEIAGALTLVVGGFVLAGVGLALVFAGVLALVAAFAIEGAR